MNVELHTLTEATPEQLAAAQETARQVARNAARNFYYAFELLPEDQHRGIEALYAFCRAGDDIADDGHKNAADLLARLRRRLDFCYENKWDDDLTLALSDAIQRFKLSREHFEEMLKGLEMDLTLASYPTFRELKLYCRRVASTVGLLCIQIFGCDTPEARRYADRLGIGMQLTNILRDLREDAGRGRIYIPASDLLRFGLNPAGMLAPENRSRLTDLVRWEAGRAAGYFRAAEESLPTDQHPRMFAARIMGAIYSRLLDKIALSDTPGEMVELSGEEKIALARSIASVPAQVDRHG